MNDNTGQNNNILHFFNLFYFIFLFLGIYWQSPWRDHVSDRNVSGTHINCFHCFSDCRHLCFGITYTIIFSILNNMLSIICSHMQLYSNTKTGLFEFWWDLVYQTKNRIPNRMWQKCYWSYNMSRELRMGEFSTLPKLLSISHNCFSVYIKPGHC